MTSEHQEGTTWIRPQPGRFTAGELLRRAGVIRVGRYDLERLAPGPLFHDCGYLWKLHAAPDRCPSEAEARSAFGDR